MILKKQKQRNIVYTVCVHILTVYGIQMYLLTCVHSHFQILVLNPGLACVLLVCSLWGLSMWAEASVVLLASVECHYASSTSPQHYSPLKIDKHSLDARLNPNKTSDLFLLVWLSPDPRCVSCAKGAVLSCCGLSQSCWWSPKWLTCGPRLHPSAGCSCRRSAAAIRLPDAPTSTPTWTSPDTSDLRRKVAF